MNCRPSSRRPSSAEHRLLALRGAPGGYRLDQPDRGVPSPPLSTRVRSYPHMATPYLYSNVHSRIQSPAFYQGWRPYGPTSYHHAVAPYASHHAMSYTPYAYGHHHAYPGHSFGHSYVHPSYTTLGGGPSYSWTGLRGAVNPQYPFAHIGPYSYSPGPMYAMAAPATGGYPYGGGQAGSTPGAYVYRPFDGSPPVRELPTSPLDMDPRPETLGPLLRPYSAMGSYRRTPDPVPRVSGPRSSRRRETVAPIGTVPEALRAARETAMKAVTDADALQPLTSATVSIPAPPAVDASIPAPAAPVLQRYTDKITALDAAIARLGEGVAIAQTENTATGIRYQVEMLQIRTRMMRAKQAVHRLRRSHYAAEVTRVGALDPTDAVRIATLGPLTAMRDQQTAAITALDAQITLNTQATAAAERRTVVAR